MVQKGRSINTPKALKYKLYKQLRLDIWGSFALKKKNNIRFTKRILKHFEFMLTRKILYRFGRGRNALNKNFPSYFGLSFFRKNIKSGLVFWMNFNKISNNLFNKFSYVRSSIFSLIGFSRANVRKQLRKLYYIRLKLKKRAELKTKKVVRKCIDLIKLQYPKIRRRNKF